MISDQATVGISLGGGHLKAAQNTSGGNQSGALTQSLPLKSCLTVYVQ
jgi:hypothetical protein